MSHTEHSCYRVERKPAKQVGTQWRAAATILRADTDEPVERLAARATTAEGADSELDAAIVHHLAELEPPRDWGRDPTVPRLLRRYLQLKDELYGMFERTSAAAGAEATALGRAADAYEREEMKKLQDQVEALTDAQLLELVTPTPEQLALPRSPWVVDALDAKERLSRFIAHRSPALRAGHERLQQALDE